MEEERKGLTVKDVLIRLILIIIFIFLLIWLFPMPDLKPLNNQIFLDNVDRMKDVAKSYYTVERLPQDFNTSKKMTLREMIDKHLILPLMDSNGNYCSEDDSYIEVKKTENEYQIKVSLSCSDKKDYIIEHFGCYDICSDKCKALEATTKKTTVKKTNEKVVTTKYSDKLYEYEFVKDVCSQKFDKYVCPSDYYLLGNKCIKNNSKVIVKDALKHETNIIATDTKKAKAVITSSTKKEPITCKPSTKTSTIDAIASNTVIDEVYKSTQKITASKKYSYDVKGAVGTVRTIKTDRVLTQNYDVITAKKVANTTEKWVYVSTLTSDKNYLAYSNENEKLVLINPQGEEVLACKTCSTTVVIYTYWRYKKETSTTYSYSCDSFKGYEKYGEDKCRKATNKTYSCPSGYTLDGSYCVKKEVSYSCSKYGSDYKLNSSNNTCVKTNVSYFCPAGTKNTNDEKYCVKDIYGCPAGTTSISGGKCSKTTYSCPPNTTDTSYTLNGTKCIVKKDAKVCSCPTGTVESEDGKYCVRVNSKTVYSCEDYPGYTLNGNKCTKTTTISKIVNTCSAGYVLNGDKCYKTKNVTDTKNADKTYTNSCYKHYKWSTKTSIKGWTYTGNKRQIN